MKSCEYCLWDIHQDSLSGKWQLAYGDPDGGDPYECEAAPPGKNHEPLEWDIE